MRSTTLAPFCHQPNPEVKYLCPIPRLALGVGHLPLALPGPLLHLCSHILVSATSVALGLELPQPPRSSTPRIRWKSPYMTAS